MEKIKYINKDFNFNELSLAHPNGLQGGSYFTKLNINNDPLYLQTKRCKTKQGIVKTIKKTYCDLMFDKNDTDVVNWFENLEEKMIDLIHEKRKLWFHDELDRDDISSAFTSPMRIYKSGKYYLLRIHLSHANILSSGEFNCYDEKGQTVDPNSLNDQEIKVIPLIEIQGVKFSSRSFSIEINLKQLMVMNKEEESFNKCLIKIPGSNIKDSNESEHDSLDSEENTTSEKNDLIGIKTEDKEDKTIVVKTEDKDEAVTDVDNDINSLDTSSSVSSLEMSTEGVDVSDEIVVDSVVDKNMGSKEVKSHESENLGEKEISLEIDDLELKSNRDDLEEFEVSLESLGTNESETIKLREPSEVYMDIWREARKKAKQARKSAIDAYLEAKQIKTTYMINEIDNSDSEDEFDNIISGFKSNDSNTAVSLGQN
jgi:hypothetical protein